MNSIFKGAATAMITPFNKNGVDYEAFKKQIDFQIENGISALVVLGTTGEPPTMTEQERQDTIVFSVNYVNKRVPLIAGTGCNCTKDTIDMSRFAVSAGADALLVVTPYYNKCTQKGLIAHYTAVADSVDKPIIMYNVPGRTGVNIAPSTAAILAKHPKICAIKEASGNIAQITEVARQVEGKIDLISGDDGIILHLLALGGVGVISVLSNLMPKEVSKLCDAYFAGDIKTARDIQFRINPLVDALFCETSPIPVKTALNLMGMNAGLLRLPLTEMDDANLVRLKNELKKLNLIK